MYPMFLFSLHDIEAAMLFELLQLRRFAIQQDPGHKKPQSQNNLLTSIEECNERSLGQVQWSL